MWPKGMAQGGEARRDGQARAMGQGAQGGNPGLLDSGKDNAHAKKHVRHVILSLKHAR